MVGLGDFAAADSAAVFIEVSAASIRDLAVVSDPDSPAASVQASGVASAIAGGDQGGVMERLAQAWRAPMPTRITAVIIPITDEPIRMTTLMLAYDIPILIMTAPTLPIRIPIMMEVIGNAGGVAHRIGTQPSVSLNVAVEVIATPGTAIGVQAAPDAEFARLTE